MRLVQTSIPEVVIVEPQVFADERGWFMETFSEPKFHAALVALGLPVPRPFVQDNHSCSRAGVLRGLHHQVAPHPQGKLVRVVRGAAWDVAVDIRPGSPTFALWVGVELSADNGRQMWIPEGFAHGFLALEDDTHFLYKTTDIYAKECERAIAWNDPALAIDWPLLTRHQVPLLAAKDESAARFSAPEVFSHPSPAAAPVGHDVAPSARPARSRQSQRVVAGRHRPTGAVRDDVGSRPGSPPTTIG